MMKELKIATSASLVATIETLRQIVRVEQTDYTDVAAVVVSVADVNAGILARLQATGFDIPTFVAVEGDEHLSPDYLPFVSGVSRCWPAPASRSTWHSWRPPPTPTSRRCCRRSSKR